MKFGKKPPGCFPHLRLIGADPPRPGFSGRCLTSFRSDHLDRTEASCARPPVRNSNSKNAVLRFFLGNKHSQQITARSSPSRHARRVRPSCLGRVQTARADGPCTGTRERDICLGTIESDDRFAVPSCSHTARARSTSYVHSSSSPSCLARRLCWR